MSGNQRLPIVLLVFFIGFSYANSGLDITTPTPRATFECLHNNGFNFVIPALHNSFGTIDQYGIQSVKEARAAGITDVDGSLFPSECSCSKEHFKSPPRLQFQVNTLWIKVQQLAWSPNLLNNRCFIESMVKQAESMNQKVGIYTSYYDWQSVVGLEYYGLYALPLWWKNYDGVEDFRYYVSFGGWTRPYIHQYKNKEDGPCNVSMQRDWKQ